MKKLFLALLFSLFFLYPSVSEAYSTFDAGTWSYGYTEPVKSKDGTDLKDLSFTTVWYRIDGGAWVRVKNIPATVITGGGVHEGTFTIDLTPFGSNIQVTIETSYTATDTSGNQSSYWIEPTQTRIDQVAPNSPTG